jgi:transmembrane sensor
LYNALKMTDYRSYGVEDLAMDELFRRWVTEPDAATIHFWEQWLADNPDRANIVAVAREMVISIHDAYRDNLSEDLMKHEIDEIVRLAELRKDQESNRFYWPAIWRAAAVLVLVAGLSWLYYTTHPGRPMPGQGDTNAMATVEMITTTNRSGKEMTVLLSDNSVATLKEGSSISYPAQFALNERKVQLTGEAFFDVAKDPQRPFLVYTSETVTKVLGTSFRVKAIDTENTIMVAVKTGRVSVYPKHLYETAVSNSKKPVAGVILDPNQQAVFRRKDKKLEKSKVSNPGLLAESAGHKEQVFDDMPVANAFDALGKAYGIVIEYNAETLASCMISAEFSDENLKQRLNAICQAIGATYNMEHGRVIVLAKGCN